MKNLIVFSCTLLMSALILYSCNNEDDSIILEGDSQISSRSVAPRFQRLQEIQDFLFNNITPSVTITTDEMINGVETLMNLGISQPRYDRPVKGTTWETTITNNGIKQFGLDIANEAVTETESFFNSLSETDKKFHSIDIELKSSTGNDYILVFKPYVNLNEQCFVSNTTTEVQSCDVFDSSDEYFVMFGDEEEDPVYGIIVPDCSEVNCGPDVAACSRPAWEVVEDKINATYHQLYPITPPDPTKPKLVSFENIRETVRQKLIIETDITACSGTANDPTERDIDNIFGFDMTGCSCMDKGELDCGYCEITEGLYLEEVDWKEFADDEVQLTNLGTTFFADGPGEPAATLISVFVGKPIWSTFLRDRDDEIEVYGLLTVNLGDFK